MRLHLIVDVKPDDGERPATSEILLEELETAMESNPLDIDGRVYEVYVLGSGKTSRESAESMKLRRQR